MHPEGPMTIVGLGDGEAEAVGMEGSPGRTAAKPGPPMGSLPKATLAT